METTTFTALCERAGRWWTIMIPQLQGLTAQARSLDQVEVMARQAVARHLGVPPETVVIEVVPDAPQPVAQALQARQIARRAPPRRARGGETVRVGIERVHLVEQG